MSSARLIVAADIFGVTPELAAAARQISSEATFVSPYENTDITFTTEADAYRYFTQQTTVEDYAEKLHRTIELNSSPALIVGFSVGAAAAWLVAACLENQQRVQFDLFYGGQIRHHLSAQPKYPINLFSPSMESHFDITAVNVQLNLKTCVEVQPTLFMHGFMNPRSDNFSRSAAQHYWSFIKKHKNAM